MKTYGIIPARMGSSRFPGKPLHPIAGKPMIEHVYARAKLSWDWDMLCIATCDEEIRDFSEKKGFPVVMTSDKHVRALDRVAEAYEILAEPKTDDDIVVCPGRRTAARQRYDIGGNRTVRTRPAD